MMRANKPIMMTFSPVFMQVRTQGYRFAMVAVLLVGLFLVDTAWSAQRITQVAGARVRAGASAGADLVAVLPLGSVLEELARSESPQRIGDSEAHWYRVGLPDGGEGWIFGALTLPFEPTQAASLYQQLADERLAQESSFAELVELSNFLARVKDQVADPEAAAHLALTHLRAVRRSLEFINILAFQDREEAAYQQWLTELEYQGLLAYNESAAEYLLPLARIWAVHDAFYPLPVSSDIAWLAVTNPWPGECEGYFSCVLDIIQRTSGRYVKLHPQGQDAPAALDNIASLLQPGEVLPEERALVLRHLAVLQATVARTAEPGDLPAQLEALQQRYARP